MSDLRYGPDPVNAAARAAKAGEAMAKELATSTTGERCVQVLADGSRTGRTCNAPADRKIAEEILDGPPRHGFSQYVCKGCFARIMQPYLVGLTLPESGRALAEAEAALTAERLARTAAEQTAAARYDALKRSHDEAVAKLLALEEEIRDPVGYVREERFAEVRVAAAAQIASLRAEVMRLDSENLECKRRLSWCHTCDVPAPLKDDGDGYTYRCPKCGKTFTPMKWLEASDAAAQIAVLREALCSLDTFRQAVISQERPGLPHSARVEGRKIEDAYVARVAFALLDRAPAAANLLRVVEAAQAWTLAHDVLKAKLGSHGVVWFEQRKYLDAVEVLDAAVRALGSPPAPVIDAEREAMSVKVRCAEGLAEYASHKPRCRYQDSERGWPTGKFYPCSCGLDAALAAYRALTSPAKPGQPPRALTIADPDADVLRRFEERQAGESAKPGQAS